MQETCLHSHRHKDFKYYNRAFINAFFWAITQRVVVISYRRFGMTYRIGFLNPEVGTGRLSLNVGNKLPLLAA